MSLCFDEAFHALSANQISDEQYLHEVLAHFCGVRHPADARATRPWEVMISDPVGNAIRDAALSSSHIIRPENISRLEHLFTSALRDDAPSVQSLIAQPDPPPIPLQALATLAAFHNDAHVLRFCVQTGASLHDRNTSLALELTTRSPALLDVLYHLDWRDMRSDPVAYHRMLAWSLHTSPDEMTWFLSRGAHIDGDLIRRAVRAPVPVNAACIAVLLRRSGVDLFRGTGLLQSAARRGRSDLVRLLLDSGADVDELVPQSSCDDGGSEATALYEAVSRQHEDTVRVLLAYGADPRKRVCQGEGGWSTPLELAEGLGWARITALLRRSLERRGVGEGGGGARL